MKPGIPWSVKGIEPEVREAAKHAARRSGMTLGEWLNTVILDQADDSAAPQSAETGPHQKVFSAMTPDAPARARSETTIRLEDIAQQLSALAKREQESSPIRGFEPPAARHPDQDVVNRIVDRIEQNERQSVEAFTAVNERLTSLNRQLSQAPPAKGFEKPEDVPGFQALEGALRNIVDHIEISERRTRDSLKTMQERMGEMALKASHASGDDILRAAPAFTGLEQRLAELAVRVQRHEASSEAGFNEAIKREVGQLAARIDNTHRHAEQLAASAQAAAAQSAQKELREIEGRIQALLNETQDTMANQQVGQADVQKLKAEIGQLNQRVDDVRGGAASARDLHTLQVAVEQLSTRMAQGPDLRPIADMDRRLADISQRLEQDMKNPLHLSQLGELETRIVELDHRLADVIRMQGDGQAMGALEHHLTDVNGRLASAEQQLGHLDTIERAITQLFDGFERHRAETGSAIERAAQLTGQQLPALDALPEIAALEQGLRAVRESAEQSDRRSQETLEAVHETLEQIVAKLAELETSAAGHQLAASLAQQHKAAPAPADPMPPMEQPWQQTQAEDFPAPVFEPASTSPAPQFQVPPSQDNPFVVPAGEAQQPRLDMPLSQPQANDFGQPGLAEDLPGDDFIAAARRAAQAAAGKSSFTNTAERPPIKRGANSRFSLPSPFKRRSKKRAGSVAPAMSGAPQPVPILEAPASASSKRRKLILAGIVLLAAVSAVTFNMLSRNKPAVKPATSAIEQPLQQEKKTALQSGSLPSATDRKVANTNTGMPSPDVSFASVASQPGDVTSSISATGKTDATIASLVAEPGTLSSKAEMPPPEVGSLGLREAAAGGDAKAQFVVASRYLDGEGMERDAAKAAYWYQQAATQGLAPAQYRVATLYEHGKGVPKDVATALIWYERAAAGGNVKAMHNAAVIAASTDAGSPDYGKAFKWFKQAADRGLQDSQFNLAVLYQRGLGTKPNTQEAYFWFAMAGANDDADAQSRADKLAASLKPEEVKGLKQRIAAFAAVPDDHNANFVSVSEEDWKNSGKANLTLVPKPELPATDNLIHRIQNMLMKLGYNIGEPDGRLGGRTSNAIRLFQLQTGMKVTGEISPELEAVLKDQAARLGGA